MWQMLAEWFVAHPILGLLGSLLSLAPLGLILNDDDGEDEKPTGRDEAPPGQEEQRHTATPDQARDEEPILDEDGNLDRAKTVQKIRAGLEAKLKKELEAQYQPHLKELEDHRQKLSWTLNRINSDPALKRLFLQDQAAQPGGEDPEPPRTNPLAWIDWRNRQVEKRLGAIEHGMQGIGGAMVSKDTARTFEETMGAFFDEEKVPKREREFYRQLMVGLSRNDALRNIGAERVGEFTKALASNLHGMIRKFKQEFLQDYITTMPGGIPGGRSNGLPAEPVKLRELDVTTPEKRIQAMLRGAFFGAEE